MKKNTSRKRRDPFFRLCSILVPKCAFMQSHLGVPNCAFGQSHLGMAYIQHISQPSLDTNNKTSSLPPHGHDYELTLSQLRSREILTKPSRVRLSGIEQDKQEVKNSGQRNLRLHKSKSLSKDRKQMQNWVSRKSSGQKSKEYDSTDGAEQLASVIGAAAAFAAIGSLEEGIQNQIKMGGEPQSRHTYSLNKSKSNMEATKGDPGKSSRRFSGQDTMKKSELRDLMMQERALENQNKANSTPVIRRIPTFADAYIGSKNLAKAVDLKPKSVPLPTVDTTIEITEDINPKGTLAVVPAIRESKSNAWENAEMAKIRSRYEKLNSRIVSWEEEKKKKARLQMDRVEAELEGKRAKALQHYRIDILSIYQIAGRARTRAKEDKIKEEIKAMEKARKIRSTGKVPVTCFC